MPWMMWSHFSSSSRHGDDLLPLVFLEADGGFVRFATYAAFCGLSAARNFVTEDVAAVATCGFQGERAEVSGSPHTEVQLVR